MSVKNNYWWRNLGSSLRTISEKTNNGMAATVVATQQQIQAADFCG
jgi:hypothetical protein